MTVSQAQDKVYEVYTTGENPILRENAWISVMLMQARDYRPPESFVPGQVDSAEEVELAKINNELQQARQRYGSEHPKVRALEQQRDYWKKYLEAGKS